MVELGLAIKRTWVDEQNQRQEEVTFVDVTIWSRQAEIAAQYLRKGSSVCIDGRLQLDSWTDKATSQKRSRLRVVSEHLQLLDRRQDNTTTPSRGAVPPRPSAQSAPLEVDM